MRKTAIIAAIYNKYIQKGNVIKIGSVQYSTNP
jgi:hypothetical protein